MSRILFTLALLILWPMPANAAPTIGAACAAGAANTETPWSNFADLNAFTTASCISLDIDPDSAGRCTGGLRRRNGGANPVDGQRPQILRWQRLADGQQYGRGKHTERHHGGDVEPGGHRQRNWDTLAGGSALKLGSTSTAAASNAQKMFEMPSAARTPRRRRRPTASISATPMRARPQPTSACMPPLPAARRPTMPPFSIKALSASARPRRRQRCRSVRRRRRQER